MMPSSRPGVNPSDSDEGCIEIQRQHRTKLLQVCLLWSEGKKKLGTAAQQCFVGAASKEKSWFFPGGKAVEGG